MKVLLISPKDPEKPGNLKFLMGGENTFTQSLLENPPAGVEYIHHSQALAKRQIISRNSGKFLSLPIKARILPPDAGIWDLEIKEKFDLIHCHAYSLRLKSYFGPVILSDSSSNFLFLKDYLGWSQARINFAYKLRRFVAKTFKVYDPNLNLYQARKLIVWSEFAKKIHQNLGCGPKKIVVIPPGIELLPERKKKHLGFNILFVGIWFERKGGPLLLEAYKILKTKYPQIGLYLVGQVPKKITLPKGVWQVDYLPREKLASEIFPKTDVLVLVPPVAEGYGLVVLEAASLRVPAIVSSVYALPEIVEDGVTGFVIKPNDLNELVEKLEILINNRNLLQKMGQAAKKRFEEKFWIKKTNKKLLRVYQEAVKISIPSSAALFHEKFLL